MTRFDWITPMRERGQEKINGEWQPLADSQHQLRGQVALQHRGDSTTRLIVMAAPGTFETDAVISAADAEGLAGALTVKPCTCPGGLPDGWRTDFDPDCPRHGTPEPTDDELRALLPAARAALHHAYGARYDVYRGDPAATADDPMLVNVIAAVLRELRTPAEVRDA